MIGGENIHIYRQIRDEGREQEDHDGNACLIAVRSRSNQFTPATHRTI
jgi:hypothetical protein